MLIWLEIRLLDLDCNCDGTWDGVVKVGSEERRWLFVFVVCCCDDTVPVFFFNAAIACRPKSENDILYYISNFWYSMHFFLKGVISFVGSASYYYVLLLDANHCWYFESHVLLGKCVQYWTWSCFLCKAHASKQNNSKSSTLYSLTLLVRQDFPKTSNDWHLINGHNSN